MNKHQLYFLAILFLCFSCLSNKKESEVNNKPNLEIYDNHVHIMSPELIKDWKDLGIPFSKPDYYYSNIDSILNINNTDYINLVGMGYVYGSPEFYQGNEEYEKLKQENNYLFKVSSKYKENVKPFFAIDPLKAYAVEELQRCLQINKNSGLKLHFSSSQVYLTEPEHLKKVKSIFAIASENNLPILLHFDNWHPKFGKDDIEILVDSILTNLKPIHLTIAHFGTSGGFNQKTKNVVNTFAELYEKDRIPEQHKILFDISAVALGKDSDGVSKLTEKAFIELKSFLDKLGYEKIAFGTDYPLYNASDYLQVLENKLGLSKSEINMILDKKTNTEKAPQ